MWSCSCLAVVAAAILSQAEKSADPPVYEQLKSIECFIGEWEGRATIPEGTTSSNQLGDVAGKEIVLTISVRWGLGKSAQIIESVYYVPDVDSIKGTSVRGWDQSSGQIRTYLFTTHKGVWSGTLKKEGETWISVIEGTNLDGEKCTFTELTTFKNKDSFVAKDVNRTVDGKPQPDTEWQFQRKQ